MTTRPELRREDFSYTYSTTGYMLQFRGRNLGGAGVREKPKHWRHQRGNLELFRESAEREIQQLLASRGQYRFTKIIDEVLSESAPAAVPTV